MITDFMDEVQYVEGIVSTQLFAPTRRGEYGLVTICDPKRPRGVQLPGGYFKAHSNLIDAARHVTARETGLKTNNISLTLRSIVYSTTQRNKKHIANHCVFGVSNAPLEKMLTEIPEGFGVQLLDLQDGQILEQYGREPQINKLCTNDGKCLFYLAKQIFDVNTKTVNSNYLMPLNVIDTQIKECETPEESYGQAIVANVLEHWYKGKKGYVLAVHNNDKLGLIGGKQEALKQHLDENIDAPSGCMAETREEFNLDVIPYSIIGSAMTPLKGRKHGCRINTALLTRGRNPLQITDALRNGKKYVGEPDKFKDLTFIPADQFENDTIKNQLRSPDMFYFLRSAATQNPSDRNSLENFCRAY